jgi:hypothetical protein
LTYQYYLGQWKLFSSLGTSESAEQRGISVDYAEYLREQKAKGVAYVGDAEMNGDSPTIFSGPGASLALTFAFIDPGTGLPAAGTPTVDHSR